MKYQISDNAETWEVEADNANAAVETIYDTLDDYPTNRLAVEVRRLVDAEKDEWAPCLYALIERDEEGGVDHSSWSASNAGPISTDWEPQWIAQA